MTCTRICGRSNCGREFTITQDPRQLYCSKSCSSAMMMRRRNWRREHPGEPFPGTQGPSQSLPGSVGVPKKPTPVVPRFTRNNIPGRIDTVEEFIGTFNVGDTVWHYTTNCDVVQKVESLVITSYSFSQVNEAHAKMFGFHQHNMVRYTYDYSKFMGRIRREGFVSDLVNFHHGAYRTQAEAEFGFRIRQNDHAPSYHY